MEKGGYSPPPPGSALDFLLQAFWNFRRPHHEVLPLVSAMNWKLWMPSPVHMMNLCTRPTAMKIPGIVEVIHRIVGKSILHIIGRDIQEAAGSLQLCAGQECGIETAIYAM